MPALNLILKPMSFVLIFLFFAVETKGT